MFNRNKFLKKQKKNGGGYCEGFVEGADHGLMFCIMFFSDYKHVL